MQAKSAHPFNHRDLGRLLSGSAEMDALAEPRREPARVYPRHDREQWIVEPPPNPDIHGEGSATFSGSEAMIVALTFAFERYGSVVHLSR